MSLANLHGEYCTVISSEAALSDVGWWQSSFALSDAGLFLVPQYPRRTPARRACRSRAADRSFEDFFRKAFSETIARIEHDRRLLIELDNPLLDGQEPLKDERSWYRPGQTR